MLVLFLSLPRFDANDDTQADIFSGSFPKEFQQAERGEMQHGGGAESTPGENEPMQHGGGSEAPSPGEEESSPSVTPSAEEVDDRSLVRQLTTATGYIALALLALTLLIGPANLLLRRRGASGAETAAASSPTAAIANGGSSASRTGAAAETLLNSSDMACLSECGGTAAGCPPTHGT